jgi:hypothetical protein
MEDLYFCPFCGGYCEAGGCGTCTCGDDSDEEDEESLEDE